jgi:hypothetical protein
MEEKSILNWDLHQKLIEGRFGKRKITKVIETNIYSKYEKEYLENNKRIFYVNSIDILSDDTVVLECYYQDRKKYYLSDKFVLYNDYPLNDRNIVNKKCEIFWVIKSFREYILNEENRLYKHKIILEDLIRSFL